MRVHKYSSSLMNDVLLTAGRHDAEQDVTPQIDRSMPDPQSSNRVPATAECSTSASVIDIPHIDNSVVPDVSIPADQAAITNRLQQQMTEMMQRMDAVLKQVEQHSPMTRTISAAPKGNIPL